MQQKKIWDLARTHSSHETKHSKVTLLRHRKVEKIIKSKARFLIVDLGCGEGLIGKFASKHSNMYIGVDFSSVSLKHAKKYVSANSEFIMADIQFVPLADKTADALICSEVLEHCPDYKNVIGEISRILRKDGDLIITTPNCFNPDLCLRMLLKGRGYSKAYDKPIPYFELLDLVSKNDFQIMHFESFFHSYPGHRYLPKILREFISRALGLLDNVIPFPLGLYMIIGAKRK